MTQLFRIAMIGCLLSACGGADGPSLGPETSPTPTQQSAIIRNVDYLSRIAAAEASGESAASAAIGFAFNAHALLGIESAVRVAPGLPASPDGCAVITDHGATWTSCQNGDTTVDGTMSWSAGDVEISLRATVVAGAAEVHYGFSGSMTASDAAIHGDMTVSFTAADGAGTAGHAIQTQLDVELATGCIYRGTLTATQTGGRVATGDRAMQVVWIGCSLFHVRNG